MSETLLETTLTGTFSRINSRAAILILASIVSGGSGMSVTNHAKGCGMLWLSLGDYRGRRRWSRAQRGHNKGQLTVKRCRDYGSPAKVLELRVTLEEKRPNESGFCEEMTIGPMIAFRGRFACCQRRVRRIFPASWPSDWSKTRGDLRHLEHSDGILMPSSCHPKQVEIIPHI